MGDRRRQLPHGGDAIGMGERVPFFLRPPALGHIQWNSMEGQRKQIKAQLAEMRSSSRQSDQTIAALREQAGIMRGQLNEMRDEQRPWIYAAGIKLADRLSVDANGIRISLLFRVTNVGHLPATQTDISLSALPAIPSHGEKTFTDVARDTCYGNSFGSSFAVFPGDSPEQEITTYLSSNQIVEFQNGQGLHSGYVSPYVIACVRYGDPSGLPHHTPYLLWILETEGGRACCAIPIDATKLANTNAVAQIQTIGLLNLSPD